MHVLGEQERPFLRAGWTEVEGFARKGAEVLELAFRIGALDASDTPGVISAKDELLNHLGDPLDTESAVDDGVFAFILFHDALKRYGLVVTVSFYSGGGTALRLGEEWHHARLTMRSSIPVWDNPNRDHPMWDDGRLEQTVLDLMISGELVSKGIVSPIIPFEQADEGYRLITEHPERCVKLGFTF